MTPLIHPNWTPLTPFLLLPPPPLATPSVISSVSSSINPTLTAVGLQSSIISSVTPTLTAVGLQSSIISSVTPTLTAVGLQSSIISSQQPHPDCYVGTGSHLRTSTEDVHQA
ncbi:unnamed protein product [Arctogadus glacialis]